MKNVFQFDLTLGFVKVNIDAIHLHDCNGVNMDHYSNLIDMNKKLIVFFNCFLRLVIYYF